jgi:hypothetical protein
VPSFSGQAKAQEAQILIQQSDKRMVDGDKESDGPTLGVAGGLDS